MHTCLHSHGVLEGLLRHDITCCHSSAEHCKCGRNSIGAILALGVRRYVVLIDSDTEPHAKACKSLLRAEFRQKSSLVAKMGVAQI